MYGGADFFDYSAAMPWARKLTPAAATGKGVILHDVQQQLLIALKAEGLI
jgi:hypothetical protein